MTNTTYEDLLFDIQKNFEKNIKIAELLPSSDDQIFDIDLNTRTIEVPQLLSVRYDHNAEIIYFRCARYLDNMDLVNTVCIVEYINADGKSGIYWVPFYDTSKYLVDKDNLDSEIPVILIPWAVGGLATAASGKVEFSVRFYKLSQDGKTFLYNMSTKPAKGEVLHGMDLTDGELEIFENEPNIIEQIYASIKDATEHSVIYWTDL